MYSSFIILLVLLGRVFICSHVGSCAGGLGGSTYQSLCKLICLQFPLWCILVTFSLQGKVAIDLLTGNVAMHWQCGLGHSPLAMGGGLFLQNEQVHVSSI